MQVASILHQHQDHAAKMVDSKAKHDQSANMLSRCLQVEMERYTRD